MTSALPLSAQVEVRDEWPESVRWVLPPRRLGAGRWLGWALLLSGTAIVVAMASVLNVLIGRGPQVFHPCVFLAIVLIGPGTLGGILPLWWGMAALWGHRELEIRNQALRTIERVGPFWKSRRWPIARIQSMEVREGIPEAQRQATPWLQIFDELNALLLHGEGIQRGMLAWGYSRELLEELARDVARRCEVEAESMGSPDGPRGKTIAVHSPSGSLAAGSKVASNEEDWLDDDEDEDEDEAFLEEAPSVQPADSRIEVERHDDFLSVRIPPAGLWRGTHGLFVFSLVWCGFMTVFDGIALLAMSQNHGELDGLYILIGFSALFWLVGIAMLLGAVNMGRRRAAIAVAGDQLMVMQTGLFGTKKREWPLHELSALRAGPSGMEVNDRPVLELQILDGRQRKFGMLAGRNHQELEWLARLLRDFTNVGREGEAFRDAEHADDSQPDAPADTASA